MSSMKVYKCVGRGLCALFSTSLNILYFNDLLWRTGEGGRVSLSSDGGPAKFGEQAEKKAHRRNQSLGSYFTSFVTKRTASVPINLDKAVSKFCMTSLPVYFSTYPM